MTAIVKIDPDNTLICTYGADGRHCDKAPSGINQKDFSKQSFDWNKQMSSLYQTVVNIFTPTKVDAFNPTSLFEELEQSELYNCRSKRVEERHARDSNREYIQDVYYCEAIDSNQTIDGIVKFKITSSKKYHYAHLSGYKYGDTSVTVNYLSELDYSDKSASTYMGNKKFMAIGGLMGEELLVLGQYMTHQEI